jgi:leader peptidase (prepilin peptidase)/N-methyltransferase
MNVLSLAAVSLPVGMAAALAAGLVAGAVVNWAVYALAWNRRAISPWSSPHEKASPRRVGDRLPVVGWLGLRRDAALHGRRFWVRPLAVELLMGLGWAALYWWEVGRQGLVAEQFAAIAGPLAGGQLAAPWGTTVATFASHALLIALMAAASLIDIDEKTIPDGITVPGTLLGLLLATILPMSLLPHAAVRNLAPAVGVEIPLPRGFNANGGALYVEPVTPVAPNEWPQLFAPAPQWTSLVIGLSCYAFWCIALAPRILRRRRGLFYGLSVLAARVLRELARPPLAWISLAGSAAIVGVWYAGGQAWVGLLSALIGMIGASAMVWAIRIAATTALRREALGFGDVTLMMMIGAYLGWQAGIILFFLSPFAALLVALLQLLLRRDDEIYYGPFLCLATLAVMVRWATFWNADSAIQQVFGDSRLVAGVLAVGVLMLWAMLVLWRNFKELAFRKQDN